MEEFVIAHQQDLGTLEKEFIAAGTKKGLTGNLERLVRKFQILNSKF